MSRAMNVLRVWLPLAVAVTGMCALVYGTVQQVLRMGGNDPQIQMAEDAAAALDAGTSPKTMAFGQQMDIARSMAPFVLVYDAAGKPVAGSGLLDGKLPDYPLGALEASKGSGENRVTWQPRNGVRVASVVVPYEEGYVVAGRSLREVEKRDQQAQLLAFIAWAVILAATLVVSTILQFLTGRTM